MASIIADFSAQAVIAQLVARRSHNPKVVSSILTHRMTTLVCMDGQLTCHAWVTCADYDAHELSEYRVRFDVAAMSAHSVAASYKPPMLVTRARLPVCAFVTAFVLRNKTDRWTCRCV